MSFRAVFVRAKQIAVEVLLRRRVLLTGKHHPQARPQEQPLAQGAVKTRPLTAEATPVNRLQRAFVGCRANESTAAKLRRNAALRLVESRYVSAAGRRGVGGSSRWGRSGAHLPVYAFLGLTLAAGERGLLEENEAENENEKMRRLPLETCCEIVRDIFQSRDSHLDLRPATEEVFPSSISSYDISNQLLGKGTSASIYAARLRQPSPTEAAVSEAVSNKGEVDDDDENEDWEMVSGDGAELGQLEDPDFVEGSFERLDVFSGVADEGVQEEETRVAEREHPLREDAGDGFDLALKMMFNYDIASNAVETSQVFEREYLPLWPSLGSGTFGDFRWENGHRAKKKDGRFLPPHPNIAEIHHAFVAATVVHDLAEARTLFPAALPTRLHIDGMGRNQTMFLVMKRYDMTLAEYNQDIGCQSQHVAMVIIAQLLEGVSHLVLHGIAHRDLKSNNILVELTGGSPRVVIADFGCCLADDAVGLQLPYPTKHMEIGGNSALMAPEVKLSVPGPNATIDYTKSDVWAAGAICYEILGLPNPFYRHRDGRPGLNSARYEDADLPGLPDSVPPGLATVVYLLLKKDPVMRPTAKVAANMIHLLLWQLPVSTFASWAGSKLIPATISLQQHLATWLLQLTAGLLCQRSPRGQKGAEVEDRRSRLNDTEHQLCATFISRVTPNELLTAANHVVH